MKNRALVFVFVALVCFVAPAISVFAQDAAEPEVITPAPVVAPVSTDITWVVEVVGGKSGARTYYQIVAKTRDDAEQQGINLWSKANPQEFKKFPPAANILPNKAQSDDTWIVEVVGGKSGAKVYYIIVAKSREEAGLRAEKMWNAGNPADVKKFPCAANVL